jgi:hypothetical protein
MLSRVKKYKAPANSYAITHDADGTTRVIIVPPPNKKSRLPQAVASSGSSEPLPLSPPILEVTETDEADDLLSSGFTDDTGDNTNSGALDTGRNPSDNGDDPDLDDDIEPRYHYGDADESNEEWAGHEHDEHLMRIAIEGETHHVERD